MVSVLTSDHNMITSIIHLLSKATIVEAYLMFVSFRIGVGTRGFQDGEADQGDQISGGR